MKFFMNDFRFKKKFGQNFLVDKNIVEKIASDIDILPNSLVIEIGCGDGKLTRVLCDKFDKVIGYEIDLEVKKNLFDNLRDFDNFEIIFDDFLKRDVISDIENVDYDNLYIVANLPYYITTPIISKIIEEKIPACEIVIMIQKEVADRLCALVGTKEYGQLTVFLNYFYDIKRVTNVSKNSFVPKPKVDSAVIKMVKKDNLEYVKDLDFFRKIVKDSFRFKRKTIKNNLCNYDINIIESVLEKYNFNINTRSENIPYYVFVELANELLK